MDIQTILLCYRNLILLEFLMNYVLEESFVPCNNTLPIHNCTSSSYENGHYGCQKLFDMKPNASAYGRVSWGANEIGDWAQLNLDNVYYINSIRIHQHTAPIYRPENISLRFANGAELETKLKDEPVWNDILLPSEVTSNHINLTIESKYGSFTHKWTYLTEVQVIGCSSGSIFFINGKQRL